MRVSAGGAGPTASHSSLPRRRHSPRCSAPRAARSATRRISGPTAFLAVGWGLGLTRLATSRTPTSSRPASAPFQPGRAPRQTRSWCVGRASAPRATACFPVQSNSAPTTRWVSSVLNSADPTAHRRSGRSRSSSILHSARIRSILTLPAGAISSSRRADPFPRRTTTRKRAPWWPASRRASHLDSPPPPGRLPTFMRSEAWRPRPPMGRCRCSGSRKRTH